MEFCEDSGDNWKCMECDKEVIANASWCDWTN